MSYVSLYLSLHPGDSYKIGGSDGLGTVHCDAWCIQSSRPAALRALAKALTKAADRAEASKPAEADRFSQYIGGNT